MFIYRSFNNYLPCYFVCISFYMGIFLIFNFFFLFSLARDLEMILFLHRRVKRELFLLLSVTQTLMKKR